MARDYGSDHQRTQNPMWRCIVVATVLCWIAALPSAVAQVAGISPADRIQWITGPARVSLGNVATLDLPAGFRFADSAGARLWEEATGNPSDGSELGVVIPPASLVEGTVFILFSYTDIGHVPDDEKTSLDDSTIDGILEAIRANTTASNQERARRGWPQLNVDGWEQRPFYDSAMHHLTWAIRDSSSGGNTVNYESRLLGRNGVVTANLVVTPERLSAAVPDYQMLLRAISFQEGQRYEQFKPGDKVAKYGLVSLITGGAAVAAVKSWKGFVKLGAALVALILAGITKLKSLFTRRACQPSAAQAGVQQSSSPNVGAASGSDSVVKCAVCGQANRIRYDDPSQHPRCGRCKSTLG